MVPPRRHRRPGPGARLAARAVAARVAHHDGSGCRQRRATSRRAATRAACGGTARTSRPPAGAATDWVLRFESVNYRATVWLNGRRVGSHTRRLPAVRGARPRPAPHRREPARRAGGQPPRRDGGPPDRPSQGRPVRRRLVELRRHPARGLPAPGRHARPRQRATSSRASRARPARPGSTCARWPRTSRTSRSTRGSRAPSAATRSSSAARRSRVAGFHLFRGSATIENPRLWSPADPHLYTVKLTAEHGGGVVQQYTQRTGIRSLEVRRPGPDAAERQAPRPARRQHARGATRRAARRSGPAEISRELRPAARPGRHDDALALPAPPARARAGRPARDRGLVRGAGLPDGATRCSGAPPCAAGRSTWCARWSTAIAAIPRWSCGASATRTRPSRASASRATCARRARITRRLDPTRLVGLAFPGYPTIGKQEVYTSLDALGVNDYFGWYPGPAELDRGSCGPGALPGPPARRLSAAGAVRDRVRRGGQPRRARPPRRARGTSRRISSPTTWAFSRRSRT